MTKIIEMSRAPTQVEVIYKCACMEKERAVNVPFRESDENVADWMKLVSFALYLDHRLGSPACVEEQMEYSKILAPENAPFIGGKPEVN